MDLGDWILAVMLRASRSQTQQKAKRKSSFSDNGFARIAEAGQTTQPDRLHADPDYDAEWIDEQIREQKGPDRRRLVSLRAVGNPALPYACAGMLGIQIS
jgi:hypothetical protein